MLVTVFGRGDGADLGTTSQVVRDCFLQLRGSSILDSFGLEVVHKEPKKERRLSSDSDVGAAVVVLTTLQAEAVRPSRVSKVSSAKTTDSAQARIEKRNENHNDNNDDDKAEGDDYDDEYSVQSDGKEKHNHSVGTSTLTAEEVKGKQGSSLATKSKDYVLYDILDDANIDCFSTLEDVVPFIEKYEVRSGNRLRVQRSISNRFKQFQCMEHIDCPFCVLISRRRSDGMFCVRKITGIHSEVCRPKQAAGGRKWKKRQNAVLDDVIDQIVRTKKGAPTPADVVKTAATKSGDVISYMTAYRALRFQTSSVRNAAVKNFEMVIPFLEGLKKVILVL